MRQLVQVEYRCARHESPVANCVGCDAVRELEAFSTKLIEARVKLVNKIKARMKAGEIIIAEMR